MTDEALNPEQQAEVRRLVDQHDVPEDRAVEMVTERILDVPLGKNGEPLVDTGPSF